MINRESIIEVIRDFHEGELPSLIERELNIPLRLRIKRVISIIGPRRAGKTYTMFQLIKKLLGDGIEKERILYINFEDYRLINIDYRDVGKILDIYYEMYPENRGRKVWIFLDEVQNVSGWEIIIRSLMDKMDAQIFISGSSSKLLSREIATQLRGRTLTYDILPFSFREFLEAREYTLEKYMSSYKKSLLLKYLDEYLRWGGYPEAVIEWERREKIINEIWEVTIARDMIDRWRIRNIKALNILIRALRESTEFSIHKFYNYLKSIGMKIGKNVLYNYIEYLHDSMIIYPLRRFSYSYKKIEKSMPKIYLVDNGLYLEKKDLGKLLENLVFIELKRRGYRENEELFYWKNYTGKEVDFIIKEGGEVKQLIQVCYELTYDNEKREIKPLITASRELRCKNLIIITMDQEDIVEKDNLKIRIIPVWKWLTYQET